MDEVRAPAAIHRARAVLVVSQIALSFILMTGAGTLGRSLWNMLRVDGGFNPSHVLAGSIWFPPPDGHEERTRKYDSLDKRSLFVEQLLRRLRPFPEWNPLPWAAPTPSRLPDGTRMDSHWKAIMPGRTNPSPRR